jgi:hypothetical protein
MDGRRPAALSALSLAFVLALAGSALYAVLIGGQGLFDKLTLREGLNVAGAVLMLWLILWPLIALARRQRR